ncbi:MAG: ABC transporter ATP-binding protein [Chitinophagales bacterium]
MAASVKTVRLCKNYDDLKVLADWNITISTGERVAILGPSGSGKTTFLRLIAGLEQPDSGSIKVDSSKIAFVFQEPRLIPWRNVRENLLFVNPGANTAEVLQHLNLSDFEEYYPAQLSGGMRQRVNLARALITNPELLILDESFTSLDLPFKLGIIRDLLAWWKEKRFTIVTVTHDLKEALYLSDRVLILSGRPAQIANDFKVDLEEQRSFSDPELLRMESRLLELIST